MSEFIRRYIVPLLARFFIRLVGITSVTKIINEEAADEARKKGKGVIFALWHGYQFPLVYTKRSKGICIMTSFSRDGELQTSIFSKFGYYVVRGSAARGGAAATLRMLREIDEKRDIAFAVDGPRGPLYKSKPGVIYLARKTGRAVVPVGTAVKRKIVFSRAWDKYIVPFPFNRCVIACGEPLYFEGDGEIDRDRESLDRAISDITEKARDLLVTWENT